MRHIPGVVFHWPAMTEAQITQKPGQQLVDDFRTLHTKKNGWRDIGYHYVIHRDNAGKWKVYDGRPDSLPGAHAGTNFGNAFLGINVAYGTDGNLPAEAVQVAAQLVADLSKQYSFQINNKTVLGHRDIVPTQCPGQPLYKELATIISKAGKATSTKPAVNTDPASKEPDEEQIGKIKMSVDGKMIDGLRVNNQAFIHVADLSHLKIDVSYNKQTDTVILKRKLE